MQFMNPENSLAVPYNLVPANARYNGPQAQWAEPDITAAANLLLQAVGDAALRRRLGGQARQDIARLRDAWTTEQLFPLRA
jgi:hypothetical protein